MILLTGATGLIGSALLRRLTTRGETVRCLVRDPRRLGPERVRVQITIGDLADPRAFRHALRGVRTVVHLAGSERDQPHATIEELDGLATWRLVRAAEQAGVEHLVFFSALGATPHHRTRVHRAKALAERAVGDAGLRTTTFAPSLVYAPGDRRLVRLERLALLPAVPLTGLGRARTQPIWADDVADCVMAALDARTGTERHERFELAGPETLTHREIVELALRGARRPRRLVPIPQALLRPLLRGYETMTGPAALATWDEAELLAVSMLAQRGTADAEALGVRPRALAAVLGV
ncbi:MAG TPA: NAD(P)H-binding protein [Solirubrobacteraceae bacterium]|nr:NAD(P)H-binding protein [Solirubrobacteraceae bacterium]